MSAPSAPHTSWLTRQVNAGVGGWIRIGEQTAFYLRGMGAVKDAVLHYPKEIVRVIAQMSMGVGALALIGGTVAIVGFLLLNVGFLIAIVGYSQTANLGVEALVGFFSAYVNPRLAAPLITAIGLAATVGAGATAQLGAMRISEEIDALEVIGVRTMAYLVATRLVGSVVLSIPLCCISLLVGFLSTQFLVQFTYGQSSGIYDHYFNTFLRPTDVLWAMVQVVLQGIVVMLIHTYYGFNASGGPAGVGEAVGRAVRASLVVLTIVTAAVGLALYGRTGNFHLSG
ncbi:ABC transporter permease [Mycobacterium vicinigordonae]|uniref:ABC transporter permease n=1 Tax=Mycobacterium vicinigordonae TaxID=1719132 RepID=A0A7D6HY48_9MYCO|nr:ABC transporter permease [Mycobacterium vicinigordonae]QLL09833.1 ABC transporter permease [Mycobacterium vicinigordonae]